MFERCYTEGGRPFFFKWYFLDLLIVIQRSTAWSHAMGVALEARRLDQVREGLNRAPLAQVRLLS
jgi:hypothetical protein